MFHALPLNLEGSYHTVNQAISHQRQRLHDFRTNFIKFTQQKTVAVYQIVDYRLRSCWSRPKVVVLDALQLRLNLHFAVRVADCVHF